ncbi:TPA: phage tail terminator-like protein [Escherichia coli]
MQYELSLAARRFVTDLVKTFPVRYPISYENVAFSPPNNGGMWLKYDYTEADTVTYSLSRKCKYYVGMVQVSVFFSPGDGVDGARRLANQLAESMLDGTMLDTGYIYKGGVVHPVVKSKSGWFIPVRFYVRLD